MKKSNVSLLVGLSIIALVLTIVINAILRGSVGTNSSFGGKKIDVFNYIYIQSTGVEGNAAVTLHIDEYEIEEDVLNETEQDELVKFLTEIIYTVNGETIEVTTYDWETLEEFENLEDKSVLLDIKNDDVILLELQSIPKTYSVMSTSIEKDVHELGIEIKNISEVSEEMLLNFESDNIEYVNLGYSFLNDYREIEAAITQGTAKRYGVFYRIDPYNPENIDNFGVTDVSGLTLALAYEFEGKIYLVTRTNLYLENYSFSGKILSFGDRIVFDDFGFIGEENSVENINKTMESKGYKLIVQ